MDNNDKQCAKTWRDTFLGNSKVCTGIILNSIAIVFKTSFDISHANLKALTNSILLYNIIMSFVRLLFVLCDTVSYGITYISSVRCVFKDIIISYLFCVIMYINGIQASSAD